MHPFINIAITAARHAGNIIVRAINNPMSISVSEKELNEFVTDIDVAVERDIIQTIQKSYPNHAILGEESGKILPQQKSDILWIIDPIDGTTNFSRGLPHFAISIAVENKGIIEHGVIYDPFKQELFVASIGRGAQLNDKRIRVSKCANMSKALIGTEFPPSLKGENREQHLKVFAQTTNSCADVRSMGSAALDLAYVACGRLDGLFIPSLKIWDIAAGIIMVTEAGGFATMYDGSKNYLKESSIVAGTPKIHGELLNFANRENV